MQRITAVAHNKQYKGYRVIHPGEKRAGVFLRWRGTVYIEKQEIRAWAYARAESSYPRVLICQMARLLNDTEQARIQTVGASQDMSTGKTLERMGLKEALRAIHRGMANTIVTQNVSRLSEDRHTLLHIMEILQDHNAVLLCTAEDAYISLCRKDISQQLYQRAFCMNLSLPWMEEQENGRKDKP